MTSNPDLYVHATKLQMKVSLTTFSCAFSTYLPQGQKKCQFLKWQNVKMAPVHLQLTFTENIKSLRCRLERLENTELSLYCHCQIICPIF